MENSEIEKEIQEEKKSISSLRKIILTFLLAVVASFAWFYYDATRHAGKQTETSSVFDTRLQNIENSIPLHEKRLAKLEEETGKLKSQGTSPAPSAAIPAEITERLAAVEKELKPLKTPATGAQNSVQVAQAIMLLSSFHRLSDAILSGKPFASQLSSFQEKFGSDDDKKMSGILSPLTPYADSGIPAISNLLSSFDDALAAVRRNEARPSENAGLWEKLMFNLTHMITIRRIDKAQPGNSVNAILGRAEDDLENEEIEAAVAEIKSLPDNARSKFAAWLEDAQISTLAPSYVDQVEEKVMKRAFSAEKPE